MDRDLTVAKHVDRGWEVIDSISIETVKSGFVNEAEAWRWIDSQDGLAAEMEQRRRRIGAAFADW